MRWHHDFLYLRKAEAVESDIRPLQSLLQAR